MRDSAARIDDHRDPRVRAAKQRRTRLDRSEDRHLGVLNGRRRVAEPEVVRDVEQKIRARADEPPRHVREDTLEADQAPDPLLRHRKENEPVPGREVRLPEVQAHEPRGRLLERHSLRKGDEPLLVVAVDEPSLRVEEGRRVVRHILAVDQTMIECPRQQRDSDLAHGLHHPRQVLRLLQEDDREPQSPARRSSRVSTRPPVAFGPEGPRPRCPGSADPT